MVRLLAFPLRRIGLVAALVTLTIAGISVAQEPGPAPSTPAPQTPPGENTVPRNPQLADPYAPGAASNPAALAQEEIPGPPVHSLPDEVGRLPTEQYGGTEALLRTPIPNLFPGGIPTRPPIANPVGNDPAAPERGMRYFNAFNCVGCHASNGGGGMGPSLSDRFFKYGDDPANIYLTIVQGRPEGMPAWGGLLPDSVVWDLVAYVRQISRAPQPEWGETISLKAMTREQVPAEFETTSNPWAYTERFSFGQKPEAAVKQAK
jgi:cytochrome c oxidase cbb3-type subunit 3